MSWHTIPRDDGWKRVTVRSVTALGYRLWLRCNACGYDVFVDGPQWCAERDIPADTPMLAIGVRLKCSQCGEKKASCWGEPSGMDKSKR